MTYPCRNCGHSKSLHPKERRYDLGLTHCLYEGCDCKEYQEASKS